MRQTRDKSKSELHLKKAEKNFFYLQINTTVHASGIPRRTWEIKKKFFYANTKVYECAKITLNQRSLNLSQLIVCFLSLTDKYFIYDRITHMRLCCWSCEMCLWLKYATRYGGGGL
jgi:hypothetical protein